MAARPRKKKVEQGRRTERKRGRKGDTAVDEAVHGAIRSALHLGRLAPGTKLQEPLIARVLGVSRERVRKALHRLVHEGWLGSVPNRGTFVPALSIAEMREIYDVRSMLEAGIVRRLSAARDGEMARRLEAHVASEREAIESGDRARLIRLTAEFHVLLARLCGNGELTRLLSGFTSRTTMRFAVSAPEHFDDGAGPHDHGSIVRAILAGEAEQASALMLAHLDGLLALQLARPATGKPFKLEDAFQGLVPAREPARGPARPSRTRSRQRS
ncbi:MAG: GntR family transcriptional regulator [Alphaproteobacteria bacterium]|nr:GntR family transcriptional regulator [Alphaproteobacteria bacterium]